MRVKEETEKAGLKLNIQITKIITSCPITLWQTKGEKVEAEVRVELPHRDDIVRMLLLLSRFSRV